MRILRSLLLVMLLLPGWAAAADNVVRLDAPRVEMEGRLSLYIDPGKRLTVEDVAGSRISAAFVPVPGEVRLGLVDGAVWLRFSVENVSSATTQWWLEAQPPYNNHVDLYVPQEDGSYAVRRAGASLPFSVREIAYRHPVFRLTVPPGTPQIYYMRIDAGKRVKARLTFWQPAVFIEAVGAEQIVLGLYLGMYLLLVLSSLWFGIAARDQVYLYFGLYVFSAILTTLTTSGLWQQYILPEWPELLDIALGFSVPLLVGMFVQFLCRFIDMEGRWVRFSTIYLAGTWSLGALTFLASVAGYYPFAMHWFSRYLFFVIAPLACLVLLRSALHRANEIHYAFATGGLFLMLTYILHMLATFHVVRPNVVTENAMYIGSMVFSLIVYHAVSRHYNTMRLAKEVAQNEALRVAQHSEQELEVRLAARTDEMMQTLQTVEAALAHAQALQQEQRHFITRVSNALPAPLAVIDDATKNLVQEGLETSPKGLARLKKVRQAARRLSVLFDDYLSGERFDEFSQGIQPQDVAVLSLFQDAIDAAQSLSDRHLFSIEASGLPMMIRVDPRLFRLTLRTLVDNAVKYTPSGTRVILKAQETPESWWIDVMDSGPGIPADERGLIFEKYHRGRSSSSRTGTGLGLSLAQRLIAMHGGTLQLISPPHGGSIFRIVLPRVPPSSATQGQAVTGRGGAEGVQ